MAYLDLGVAIFAVILALLPISSYLVSRFYYCSSISIRVSGDQSGDPIPLPSASDSITFGITTDSDKEVVIEDVRISFNPKEVELNEDREAVTRAWHMVTDKGTAQVDVQEGSDGSPEPQSSVNYFPRDSTFPAILRMGGSPLVTKEYLKLYAWKYQTTENAMKFQVRITINHRLQEHEMKLPWDMFPPRLRTFTKILNFQVDKEPLAEGRENLLRYGFMLKPKESSTLGRGMEKK